MEDNLENYYIIDARTKEEYDEGHVPGSINIPHEEVLNHISKIKTISP
ncbi:rhodanese-like domain-containing protein [Anaerococcus sp. ENR1011]|uniref:Rhodanese-like domain-containing protein n=1 Tax=Anaerococcus groningensis TaxID=3115616 RepID=A0ABW9MXZ5_9FIRM